MSLRVLSVGNAYPPHVQGGYELVWQSVNQRLREETHTARVLTTGFRREGASAEVDPDVHRSLRWYWREHTWPNFSRSEVLAIERHNAGVIDHHLAEFKPDVIAWWPMGGMSLSLIERVRRRGVPAVLFVHDYWPMYGRQRDLWTSRMNRHRLVAWSAERVTAIPARLRLEAAGRFLFNSETVRRRVADAGLRPDDADVLPPGIPARWIAAIPSRDWRWQLLYAGRVVEPKGVHTAVAALAGLPPMTQLRVVGDGDPGYRAELRRLAERLGIRGRVSFEPFVARESLTRLYDQADALIFPVEWEEPFGLVPLEAMARGVPVVATGRGGSGDYLRDGQNALLFVPGDEASLVASIQRLAAEPELRQRLVGAGIETARANTQESFDARAVEELVDRAAMRAGGCR